MTRTICYNYYILLFRRAFILLANLSIMSWLQGLYDNWCKKGHILRLNNFFVFHVKFHPFILQQICFKGDLVSYLQQVLIKVTTAFLTDDWFVTMWIIYCDVVQILSPNEFDDYSFRYFFTNCEKFQIVTKNAKCMLLL